MDTITVGQEKTPRIYLPLPQQLRGKLLTGQIISNDVLKLNNKCVNIRVISKQYYISYN